MLPSTHSLIYLNYLYYMKYRYSAESCCGVEKRDGSSVAGHTICRKTRLYRLMCFPMREQSALV